MSADLTGITMTIAEVNAITKDIEEIMENFKSTMHEVQEVMNILTGQSEGGLIDQTTTAVIQLRNLVDVLVANVIDILWNIADFVKTMCSNDTAAKEELRNSIHSRAYGYSS